MIRVISIQMMDSGGRKCQDPVNSSYPSIQPNPHILITRMSVTQSKWIAIIAQVLQTAKIKSITKSQHLSFWSIQPTLFLICIQDFVKITNTHPKESEPCTQFFEHGPGVFLVGGFRVSIETFKLPSVINSMVNNGINVII